MLAENFYKTKNFVKAKKIYKRIKDNGMFYHWHASKQISNILIIEKKEDVAQTLLKKAFEHQKAGNATFVKAAGSGVPTFGTLPDVRVNPPWATTPAIQTIPSYKSVFRSIL